MKMWLNCNLDKDEQDCSLVNESLECKHISQAVTDQCWWRNRSQNTDWVDDTVRIFDGKLTISLGESMHVNLQKGLV